MVAALCPNRPCSLRPGRPRPAPPLRRGLCRARAVLKGTPRRLNESITNPSPYGEVELTRVFEFCTRRRRCLHLWWATEAPVVHSGSPARLRRPKRRPVHAFTHNHPNCMLTYAWIRLAVGRPMLPVGSQPIRLVGKFSLCIVTPEKVGQKLRGATPTRQTTPPRPPRATFDQTPMQHEVCETGPHRRADQSLERVPSTSVGQEMSNERFQDPVPTGQAMGSRAAALLRPGRSNGCDQSACSPGFNQQPIGFNERAEFQLSSSDPRNTAAWRKFRPQRQ